MKNPAYTDEQYEHIILEYKLKRAKKPDLHIEYVKSLSANFSEIIVAATVALDMNGEKHIHQYRMNNARLRKFAHKLCEHEKEIKDAKNFEEIFKIISTVRVFGMGSAVHYDTSLRIAHTKPGCLPGEIYLIRGVLKGAKNIGVETKGKTIISKNELPKALAKSNLNCAELADLLCCYFAEGKWSDSLEFE